MNYSIESLTGFMKNCQDKYNVSANNLANSTTGAFKKALVLERENQQSSVADLAQGPMRQTENPLDLAIAGTGFFAVRTETGVAYTRDGAFKLNERKELVNQRNDLVLDSNGGPIVINGNPSIAEDGTVYSDQDKVGKLIVVKPQNEYEARSRGDNYFDFNPDFAEKREYSIQSGYLEESNVNPLDEMINGIEILRNFEFAERLLKMNQSMSEKSATEIGNSTR